MIHIVVRGSARAFHITSSARPCYHSLILSLASTPTNSEQESKPLTGWNHKLPSQESAFWKSELSSEATSTSSNSNQSSELGQSQSIEPRTGWLHNTASPSSAPAPQLSSITSPAQILLQQAMKEQERNHRMISPPTFHACSKDRQVVVTEHKIALPLHRSDSQQLRLDVYFTVVEKVKDVDVQWWKSLNTMSPTQRAKEFVQHTGMTTADGMILYLQGGPGFGAPTPMVGLSFSGESSWAAVALDKYPRIVLMDQRGTGRSTPITKQTLQRRFPDLFVLDSKDDTITIQDLETHSEQTKLAILEATNYMAQFRADNIVKDAEDIKDALLLPCTSENPRPYGAVLGQSYGGFCIMTYLSQASHPPKICLLTGGIAPMLTPAYDAYDSLWERVKDRSLQYYSMYPGDIKVVKKIVTRLIHEPAFLPSGGKLTARRFLSLGLSLGGTPSSFASMHTMFATAFVDDDDEQPTFTRAFLKVIDSAQSFDDAPIYFLLHESIYANGSKHSPTDWAAHRAYESRIKTPSDFDYTITSQMDSDTKPTLFFGEMVFPWFADGDFEEVSGIGMKSLAEALAKKEDWAPLYDKDNMRKALADGSISRAAAAVYYDDMYVDFNACMKVAKRGGPLENCKLWITNEYQHSGLRDNGAEIFTKLHGMATGSVRTPS